MLPKSCVLWYNYNINKCINKAGITVIDKIFPQNIKDIKPIALILIQDKVYEVKFSQVNTKLNDNGLLTTDKLKNKIIQNIIDNLKNEPTINNGKLTFNLGKFIAKVEVVKKMKMPE